LIKVNSKGGWEINNGNNLKPALPSGDELLQMMEALANPHRLQIIALLTGRRVHVSQLAREARISRPLLYMHLKRLETAGLVTSRMELSEDGKAMNFFEVTPFVLAPWDVAQWLDHFKHSIVLPAAHHRFNHPGGCRYF
jgi:DNA-binding transcriptional ArsR family regulator